MRATWLRLVCMRSAISDWVMPDASMACWICHANTRFCATPSTSSRIPSSSRKLSNELPIGSCSTFHLSLSLPGEIQIRPGCLPRLLDEPVQEDHGAAGKAEEDPGNPVAIESC